MVRNDLLLRIILFAFLFLIISRYAELFGLLIWLPKEASGWFGIIVGAASSFFLHRIIFHKIEASIIKRGEVTTTVRWMLYIITGGVVFVALIKLLNGFVLSTDIDRMIFTGSLWDQIKGLGLFLLLLYGSYLLTRLLVNMIGFIAPQSLQSTTTPIVAPVKQVQDLPNTLLRSKNDKQTLHGSAEFFPWESFNERYNGKSNEEMRAMFEEIPGYVIRPNSLKYVEHSHMMTIAGAGQGKGTTSIIPNLLTAPQNSWIILDVKGELAAVTARFQQECGQKVFILDPFKVQTSIGATHGISSSGFNPLIVAKYLPKDELIDFSAMIAEMIIPQVTGNADNFWPDSARNLVKGYIMHILTDDEIEQKHIGLLYEWLRLDQEKEIDLWVDMSFNEYTKFAANEIRSIASKSDKTWIGILSEARRATAFLESPLIRQSLQSSQFDPMFLQDYKATVYVILPERNLDTQKTWLRLVFGSTLKVCNFSAKRRVNFLMDEFPILGKMNDFLRAFAFGRGQKISCWVIAQSLSQLKDIYGEDGLNQFLGNATLKQYFGMNDLYTQKFVSDSLGLTTEVTRTENIGTTQGSTLGSSRNAFTLNSSENTGTNYGSSSGSNESITQRPLMTPEEVGKLRNDFILFVHGDKYVIPKTQYFLPGIFPDRFDPNPYVSNS